MAQLKLNLSLYFKELGLFGAVQLLGLWVAALLVKQVTTTANLSPGRLHFSWADLVFLVGFAALLIFLSRRHSRVGTVLFRVVFVLAIFSGVQLTVGSFVGPDSYGWALLVALVCVLVTQFYNRVAIHNVVMVLTLAGIGALLGLSVTPIEAVILLALLSFYDIWAVYKTGHMIQLTEGMIRAGAISGVVIPPGARGLWTPTRSFTPGGGSMILGSGDILFPLVLSVAVMRSSLPAAIVIAGCSVLGLLAMHLLFVNQTERRPMAALPPIATATILGYLIILLI